jgi:hypothetical protein
MTTTWVINQLERTLDENGVIVAHWRATATDGDFSATNYGTCGFTPDPSASGFIAYDSITEEVALGWCWADGVDKDAIEASLQANIDLQKNPTQASGVPWS